jgi:predicted ferric reductase
MKNDSVLTVTSLLSAILFGLHLTSDIYFGKEQGNLQDYIGGTVITVVLAYSTLVLTEWRWARVVVLIGGLFSLLMPALHMKSGVGGDFAKSPGGYFFIWTLFAMGLTGSLSFILSIRGLLASRSARSQ